MIQLRSVRDAEVEGKRVLLRVDFNVPMDKGSIVEDFRIRAAVPTIELLIQKGAAQITLMTHLGRPEGKVDEELRTAPLFKRLSELTDVSRVTMLENVRFDAREDANDPTFAKELAAHGDLFVNDAFAVSHRKASSTVGVSAFLPSFAGLLVEKEVTSLSAALTPPAKSIALIGGAKFETKQPLLEKLLESYVEVLLGGALANDLLKARGMSVGTSLVSSSPVPEEMSKDVRIVAPDDVAAESATVREALAGDVQADERIVDIGMKTQSGWANKIASAEFVVWNGPMGIYEKGYVAGTDALAKALVESNTRAVIGGGDTAAALAKYSFDPERIFVSTGGGAMLEFLTNGGSLPAIDVLREISAGK